MTTARNAISNLTRWLIRGLLPAAIAVVLSACAGTQQLETHVRAYSKLDASTFSTLPAEDAGQTYQFERLPSQQQDDTVAQDELEQQTRVALQKVGLAQAGSPGTPEKASPRYSAQVMLRQTEIPLYDGFYGPDPFWGWGGWGWGPGYYSRWASPYWRAGNTETRSELTLLLRDLKSGQVVFEGHALHSDLAVSRKVLIPALLEAVLRDFPNPPSGPREIDIPLHTQH